jgi:hypothetical protein
VLPHRAPFLGGSFFWSFHEFNKRGQIRNDLLFRSLGKGIHFLKQKAKAKVVGAPKAAVKAKPFGFCEKSPSAFGWIVFFPKALTAARPYWNAAFFFPFFFFRKK